MLGILEHFGGCIGLRLSQKSLQTTLQLYLMKHKAQESSTRMDLPRLGLETDLGGCVSGLFELKSP